MYASKYVLVQDLATSYQSSADGYLLVERYAMLISLDRITHSAQLLMQYTHTHTDAVHTVDNSTLNGMQHTFIAGYSTPTRVTLTHPPTCITDAIFTHRKAV